MTEFARLMRWTVLMLAASAALAVSTAAGAASDPLFVFAPVPPKFPVVLFPPPYGNFNGPCGLGVDSSGSFYVSDYYRDAIDVYEPNAAYGKPPQYGSIGYITQLAGIDPLDGPCGVAFDSADHLYVNVYHRSVIRFGARPAFGTGAPIAGAGAGSGHPTGVAVDTASGDVYVDERTYVAVYDSLGAPVLDGGEALQIGLGDLGEGYGVALSQFPATLGWVYIPDAATNTVKVYDPSSDTLAPVAEIDGSETPEGKFVSLRDAAIAVDRVTGEVYVVDDLQPHYAERPQAIVYVFSAAGTYKGHLKYLVTTARPAGLAVDNSAGATQGRIYVTSGNTIEAAVYAYPPGAATTESAGPPAPASAPAGKSDAALTSDLGQVQCANGCPVTSGEPAPRAAPGATRKYRRTASRHRRVHRRKARHAASPLSSAQGRR